MLDTEKSYEVSAVASHGNRETSDQEIDHEHAQVFHISAEDDARVRRKIDMVVLPLMCLVFFCQYLDKQSLSYASVYGLITDLHLHGSQYSWFTSIFYLAQLFSEFPFIYFMARLPVAKFVGGTVIVWGGVCMCLAAPHSFGGFAAVRFLLGFVEGAVSPGFVIVTSHWYRKDEHPMRVGMWITCNGLAQVVGSLLMYGLGENGHLALAAWRIMFIIAGSITVVAGILFYLLMPADPATAWFLTPEDRVIAEKRLATQHEGGDKTSFSAKQLKEACLDIKTFLTFMFGLMVTMTSPVLTFASLVIKNLGYTSSDTLLYGSPSGAVQIVFIWIGIVACYYFPNSRSLIVMLISIVPLVGCILLLVLPISAGWGMIVASWLASVISSQFSILLSLSASNVRGNTKKAVINAVFFIGYATGCVAAPQLWTNAPRYRSGVICAIVFWVLLYPIMGWYWWICRRSNQQRKVSAVDGIMGAFVPGSDVTDKEDASFVYTT